MKRKYIKTLAFGMALTCAVPAMAQNKVVQGTVLDDLGEPVICLLYTTRSPRD